MTRTQSITADKTDIIMLTAYVLLYPGIAGATSQQQQETICSNTSEPSIDASLTSPPDCVVDPTIKRWLRFQNLVDEWRHERGAMSSITEMATLRPYQNIIGMGEEAIPLILAELKSEGDEPDQWFWALGAITGANPVSPEDQGNFAKMAQAWFKWAEDEGHAG
jgi:hypothetical protein